MRILVAVGENHAGCANPLAAITSFPWPKKSVFSVLSVAEIMPPPSMLEVGINATDIQKEVDATAKMNATSGAALLKHYGFAADGIEKEGDPKREILDHAKEWGADLIVIGSCDKSRIEKLLLGSVSESVVKHAPCSVLVVKPSTADDR
jgi:nucleotide-binding universal stress UspA family protein